MGFHSLSMCLSIEAIYFLFNVRDFQFISRYTPISRSRHFEIESEAPVGRNPEVKVNNNDLDYQPRAATAI